MAVLPFSRVQSVTRMTMTIYRRQSRGWPSTGGSWNHWWSSCVSGAWYCPWWQTGTQRQWHRHIQTHSDTFPPDTDDQRSVSVTRLAWPSLCPSHTWTAWTALHSLFTQTLPVIQGCARSWIRELKQCNGITSRDIMNLPSVVIKDFSIIDHDVMQNLLDLNEDLPRNKKQEQE